MIEIRAVDVLFGRTIALAELSTRLAPGLIGLFGPNGSGKSTLLRLVSGLLHPTRGSVTFDGTMIDAADESWRRRVGYAGHRPGLYPRLTAIENLELFGRMYGASESRSADLLGALGIADWADTPVGGLSEGLRRRVAAARALVHDPQVLLLDEPYANLDDDAAKMLSDVLVSWRGPGKIGIIATHGAKRVKGYADASLILKRGRLVSHRVRVEEHA